MHWNEFFKIVKVVLSVVDVLIHRKNYLFFLGTFEMINNNLHNKSVSSFFNGIFIVCVKSQYLETLCSVYDHFLVNNTCKWDVHSDCHHQIIGYGMPLTCLSVCLSAHLCGRSLKDCNYRRKLSILRFLWIVHSSCEYSIVSVCQFIIMTQYKICVFIEIIILKRSLLCETCMKHWRHHLSEPVWYIYCFSCLS